MLHIIPDYHLHTSLCKHASGHPAEYKAAAAAKNMQAICFTDHIPAPDGYDSECRMTPAEFPLYRNMVVSLQKESVPKVGFGIEADYYPGATAFLTDWLPKQKFDLVLGSIHFIGTWAYDNPAEKHRWETVDLASVWRQYFDLLRELVDTRLFDVISHLDLPKKFGYRPPEKTVKEIAAPVLDRIKETGMAVEINTAGARNIVNEFYPAPYLLKMIQERNIPICFGSDAHKPEDVGFAFDDALKLAREIGFTTAVRFHQRHQTTYALPE